MDKFSRNILRIFYLMLIIGFATNIMAAQLNVNNHKQSLKYSFSSEGLPLFITYPHISPKYIQEISRFRSLEGHAYPPCKFGNQDCFTNPDDYQYRNCESDKHYFNFTNNGYQILPPVYAPCSGTIAYVRLEQDDNPSMGYQIGITVDGAPEYMVVLFHINIAQYNWQQGNYIAAGTQLGNHATSQTMSDVAVLNTQDGLYSSEFQYMTTDVLNQYGLTSNNVNNIIIPESTREKYPSLCTNSTDPLPPYVGPGTPPANWCPVIQGIVKCP